MSRLFSAAVVAILGLLVAVPGIAGENIGAADAYGLSRRDEILLIDIRTPQEWRSTGVPATARRVDFNDARGPAGFLENILTAVGNDRNRPLALICRTGHRTALAQRFLESKGFTHVVNVAEGIQGSAAGAGWIKQGLPMEVCGAC